MRTISSGRPGRKVEYDWGLVESEAYRLLDERGEFNTTNKRWNAQARLEDALLDFCMASLGREPSLASLRRQLPAWLETWRARRISQLQAAE